MRWAVHSHQILKCKPQMIQLITSESFDYNYQFLSPNLEFWFWDNNSHELNTVKGFWAGTFINCHERIPSPSNWYDQVFWNEINIHLQSLTQSSSYISVWEGILSAFYHRLRSFTNAHVIMINLCTVYEQQLSDIPDLYLTAHTINQLELVINRNYHERKKWLMWDEIQHAAVVACFTVEDFCCFIHSVSQIVPILCLNKIEDSTCADKYHWCLLKFWLSISRASGKIVRRLLAFTDLSEAFVDFAVCKIATSWKFLSYDNSQRWKSYLDRVYNDFNLQLMTTDNALQITSNLIPFMRVSLKVMVTGDTFQDWQARIEYVMTDSLKRIEEHCMRVQWR